LSDVYDYVVGARDTVVTGPSGAANTIPPYSTTNLGSSLTQTLTITNYRDEALELQPSITAGTNDFSVSNSTCTLVSGSPLTVQVGAATVNGAVTETTPTSCNLSVRFAPAINASTDRSGNLRIEFTGYSAVQPAQRNIALSGTAGGPVYVAVGAAALATPGFAATTDGAQTMCPRISNSSGTVALSIAFSSGQAVGASADYSNYYQIGTLADCAGSSLPAQCVASASSVTGSGSVAAGASCTLPIKSNPAKFGFAGGTGARSARLTVTHDSPSAGTLVNYTMVGNVTIGAEPSVGLSTSPGPDASGRVLPSEFSSQVVGTTSAQWNQFLVSNIGTADGLDVTAVTLSNPTEFPYTENCVAAAPLARLTGSSPTCTIALTFRPAAEPTGLGRRCTTVTVQAAFSGNGDQSVTVCGTGVPVPVPQMVIAPTSITFGNRSIGAIYRTEPITIGNAIGATAALQIGAVGLSSGGFAFVPDASACANKTLAAGTSCTLQLQFIPNPAAPGVAYAANVTVAGNDPTTPNATIALSGTAVPYSVPALSWEPVSTTAVTFPGLVIAGQTSATLVVRLVNPNGPGGVNVDSIRVTGADAASFAATGCPPLLYQGDPCDIGVTFLPGSGGAKTAQLSVTTTNGVAPPVLGLTGQGMGSTSGFLSVSAPTLSFGSVRVGARSLPMQLRLAAGGDGVLNVTGISADAPFSIESTTCATPPFTLPLGADCSITVTFAPTGTSPASGKVRIATDTGARAVEVNLEGNGQEAADLSSGGGCSVAVGDSFADPTLWTLVLLALASLGYRHRARRRDGR
jgi:trimeric autotransporter adhesin